MHEQIGPRALLREVKAEAPGWMSILPRLPRLVHQSLTDGRRQHAAMHERLDEISRRQQRSANFIAVLGALLAALAAFEIWRFFG
jgi:ubiquinone biosynthesis protein